MRNGASISRARVRNTPRIEKIWGTWGIPGYTGMVIGPALPRRSKAVRVRKYAGDAKE